MIQVGLLDTTRVLQDCHKGILLSSGS